jgi:hypothetical protein
MIDAREQLRRGDDGTDGPGWLALGAGLGWITVAALALSVAAAARLGAWALEAQAATECRTAENLAALAAHRAPDLSACPELVPMTLPALLGLEVAE